MQETISNPWTVTRNAYISQTQEMGGHRTKRLRLWEINSRLHCSIVGTCLTLSSLRQLARKVNYQSKTLTDANLHSHFVHKAASECPEAKALDKILNRRHEAAVRRFSKFKSATELSTGWDEAFNAGDIPGAYWAVLSHPNVDENLSNLVHGEVHMLSHLVGASNRADIRALQRLERENTDIQERLSKERRSHQRQMDDKEKINEKCRNTISKLKVRLERADHNSRATLDKKQSTDITNVENEIALLRHQFSEAQKKIDRLYTEKTDLSNTVKALKNEVKIHDLVLEKKDGIGSELRPLDLDGSIILYVGGLTSHVSRLRSLITEWNGELIHHDGGLERSLNQLAAAVVRSDVVVFPTDCVSHSAVKIIKRLCRQHAKHYFPLRTSGVASFMLGIQEGIEGFKFARSKKPSQQETITK